MIIRWMRHLFAFTLATLSVQAATYYLAPASLGGDDSNSGANAAHPWLSPLHVVSCGDVLIAKAGAYSASNFHAGAWGSVTCAGANNVAWVTCEVFDTCKITVSGQDGMRVDADYWGVQGFEVVNSGTKGGCFTATPSGSRSIHHIIFANNVANGCPANGFSIYNYDNAASVDYVAIVGNIAWDAARSTTECDSGISVYQPKLTDTAPGTHIYIAGNFLFDNYTGATACGGEWPTDGNGIILDSIDFGQGGGTPYCGQIAVENNIAVFNGGRGITSAGSGNSCASIFYRNNTMYGNSTDNRQRSADCAEMTYNWHQYNVTSLYNIAQSAAATACGGQLSYGWIVDGGNKTDVVSSNLIFGVNGQNTLAVNNAGGFSFGPNVYADPQFVNPANPGRPMCGSKTSVPDCMASVIRSFRPQAAQARGFGYQPASSVPKHDPWFPDWLCNVDLPAELITTPCAQTSPNSGAGR